jgi:integrase
MTTATKRRSALRSAVGLRVAELIPKWLEAVKAESGENSHTNCRFWILPFAEMYGWQPVEEIKPADLFAYRSAQSKAGAISSANVRLSAAKRFLVWAALMEYRPPIQTLGIRRLKRGPLPDKAWPEAQVQAHLRKALAVRKDDVLFRHLAVQYLAFARPTELLRLVEGAGVWEAEGVFKLAVSKTESKNGIPRRLILCERALELLSGLKPTFKTWQTYWRASTDATDTGPHRYRHSAAAHLSARLGAEQYDTVRLMLGHYGHLGVTPVYTPPLFASLRPNGQMLAVNVPTL